MLRFASNYCSPPCLCRNEQSSDLSSDLICLFGEFITGQATNTCTPSRIGVLYNYPLLNNLCGGIFKRYKLIQ